MQYKHVVQSVRTCGLCNRLRAMAGARTIAKLHDAKFWLHWAPNVSCPGRFEHLFETDGISMISRAEAGRRGRHDDVLYCAHKGDASPTTSAVRYRQFAPYEMEKEDFWALVQQQIMGLRPAAPLLRKIDDFSSDWPPAVIGAHVRRTDLMRCRVRSKAFFPRLDAELEKNPDVKFLLCCDCQHPLQAFRRRYGRRTLFYPKSFQARNPGPRALRRQTSMEAAVIDLYLLARTQKIYGSNCSSFSYYAANLGNIPCERLGRDRLGKC